ISSIVRERKCEQFSSSVLLGLRFAPEAVLGLQRAALVIKICARVRPAVARKRSKFLPDWSPENGIRVRSAPFLPGASPINKIRESRPPFNSLNTAVRSHIDGQRVQAAALAVSSSKVRLRFSFCTL